MSVFYIKNGKEKKIRHHFDVRMPQGVKLTISEEETGCQEQCFESSSLKPVIRFRKQPRVEVDADKKKLRVLYAASAIDFFKVSIRFTEPYIYNIKEIGERLVSTFLNMPKDLARGAEFGDIPGNITSKSVVGMHNYKILPSSHTLEMAEFIEDEGERPKNSFDCWLSDQEMLDKGILLMLGNENGTEFIRYYVINSLIDSGEIFTAYVRPSFWKEYDI